MQLGEGILTLRPLEGKLTRDTEVLGSMSPYLTFTFGGKKYKSKVHDNAGKKPKWTDEFVFEIESVEDEMTMRVWDQDMTTSDAVGFTKIKMSSLMINCGVESWFTIMYDNKPAGEILLQTTFEPKGGNQYENMKVELETQNAQLAQEAEAAKAQLEQLSGHQQQLQQQLQAQEQRMQQERQQMEGQLNSAKQNENMQGAQLQ